MDGYLAGGFAYELAKPYLNRPGLASLESTKPVTYNTMTTSSTISPPTHRHLSVAHQSAGTPAAPRQYEPGAYHEPPVGLVCLDMSR